MVCARFAAAKVSRAWPETLQTLIGIQDQVLKCRRLAAEIFDPETSRRLYELKPALRATHPPILATKLEFCERRSREDSVRARHC
jgi:hypothetical protein